MNYANSSTSIIFQLFSYYFNYFHVFLSFHQEFDKNVVEFLLSMKYAFDGASKSDFRFFKFHMLLHVANQLLEFGNLDIADANRKVSSYDFEKTSIFFTDLTAGGKRSTHAPPRPFISPPISTQKRFTGICNLHWRKASAWTMFSCRHIPPSYWLHVSSYFIDASSCFPSTTPQATLPRAKLTPNTADCSTRNAPKPAK